MNYEERLNEIQDKYQCGKIDLASLVNQSYLVGVKHGKAIASDGVLADVSARLSSSLGECVEGNDYEIVADKDGRFWINHKVVGSGEPLTQWIDSVLNVR